MRLEYYAYLRIIPVRTTQLVIKHKEPQISIPVIVSRLGKDRLFNFLSD